MITFFIPGLPTGHGPLKTLDPRIGKKFVDGLYTLAKAGPEQRWKAAIVEAAHPFKVSAPYPIERAQISLWFVLNRKKDVRPLRVLMDAMLDTLTHIDLIDHHDIQSITAMVSVMQNTETGCKVAIS